MAGRGRRRGGLTEEERALWEAVARTAAPLHPARPEPPAKPARPAPPARPLGPRRPEVHLPEPAPPPEPRVLRPEGRPEPRVSVRASGSLTDPLDPAAGLDRRTAERLRRGRRDPEARLDLHGLTAERAHAALGRFLREQRRAGARCVLVITGKGGRRSPDDAPWLPEGMGALRHAVPRWLRTPPLSELIVGLYAAHRTHGGEGALYVYLRKRREG